MKKLVNGQLVDMTPAEIAELQADWAASVAPVTPAKVTAAQARIALRRANLLPAVEAAVAAAGGETAIWFEYATEWRRDSQHVAALAGALDLSAARIDELFRTAASVE